MNLPALGLQGGSDVHSKEAGVGGGQDTRVRGTVIAAWMQQVDRSSV